MVEKEKTNEKQIIVDVTGAVLGRVASYIAKQALLGKKVIVVNCDSALLTGGRRMIIGEYGIARRRSGNSLNGPHFPKHTERLMKRTVRGMLSYTQQRGLDALKRVICHPNVPKEYESMKKITFDRPMKTKTISLAEISKEI